MDYGPHIAAAFGSLDEASVKQLRTVILDMIKKSKLRQFGNSVNLSPVAGQYFPFDTTSVRNSGNNDYVDDPMSPVHHKVSFQQRRAEGQQNVCSSSSTGMRQDRNAFDSRSFHSGRSAKTNDGTLGRRSTIDDRTI